MQLPKNLFADWNAHDSIAALVLIIHIGVMVAFPLIGKEEPAQLSDFGLFAFGYLFRGGVSTIQARLKAATAVLAKTDVQP